MTRPKTYFLSTLHRVMREDAKRAVPKRRRGGQPGNRNAVKTGKHTALARDLRKLNREMRREARRVILLAKASRRSSVGRILPAPAGKTKTNAEI